MRMAHRMAVDPKKEGANLLCLGVWRGRLCLKLGLGRVAEGAKPAERGRLHTDVRCDQVRGRSRRSSILEWLSGRSFEGHGRCCRRKKKTVRDRFCVAHEASSFVSTSRGSGFPALAGCGCVRRCALTAGVSV